MLIVLFLISVGIGAPALHGQRPRLAPVGNYHGHLVSEVSGRLRVPRPLRSVDLPGDLDRVVRDYERFTKSGDPDSLTALFAQDGFLALRTGWIRGRGAIGRAAVDFDPQDLHVRAHSFALYDSVATITGSLADSSGPRATDFAKILVTMHRGPDGRWLIDSFLREDLPRGSGAPFTAEQLVAQSDSAGVQRALVLSVAYWFGSALMAGADPDLSLADEHARVRAENDWVASQVARYPNRLTAFCSLNPLKPYAVEEIQRCGRQPGIRGLKLHLANSTVDLRRREDVDQLRRVFRAANEARLAIVVHLRPRLKPYGRQDAETFLREIRPEAPDIPIQIAHLVGWGGYDDATDEAVAVFSDAIARNDPLTKNLYFDLTSIVFAGQPLELRQRIANRIRQLGLRRVLFGSDLADALGEWARLEQLLPLTRAEFTIIAGNVTSYLHPTPARTNRARD